jgi:hypothetical protein
MCFNDYDTECGCTPVDGLVTHALECPLNTVSIDDLDAVIWHGEVVVIERDDDIDEDLAAALWGWEE